MVPSGQETACFSRSSRRRSRSSTRCPATPRASTSQRPEHSSRCESYRRCLESGVTLFQGRDVTLGGVSLKVALPCMCPRQFLSSQCKTAAADVNGCFCTNLNTKHSLSKFSCYMRRVRRAVDRRRLKHFVTKTRNFIKKPDFSQVA